MVLKKIKNYLNKFFKKKKKEIPYLSDREKIIMIKKIIKNTSLLTKPIDDCVREIFAYNGECRNSFFSKNRNLNYREKGEKYLSEYGNAEDLYGEEICKRIVDFRTVPTTNYLFSYYVNNFIRIAYYQDFVYLHEYILKNIHGDIQHGIRDSLELGYMKPLYRFEDEDVFGYYSDFRRAPYDTEWLHYYCEPWNGHSATLEYNFISYQFYKDFFQFKGEFPVPFRELHTTTFWHYRMMNNLPQTKEHIILSTNLYHEHLLNNRRSFLLYQHRRAFMPWYLFLFTCSQLTHLPVISTLVWNAPISIIGIIQLSVLAAIFEVFCALPDGSSLLDLGPNFNIEYLDPQCFWWIKELKNNVDIVSISTAFKNKNIFNNKSSLPWYYNNSHLSVNSDYKNINLNDQFTEKNFLHETGKVNVTDNSMKSIVLNLYKSVFLNGGRISSLVSATLSNNAIFNIISFIYANKYSNLFELDNRFTTTQMENLYKDFYEEILTSRFSVLEKEKILESPDNIEAIAEYSTKTNIVKDMWEKYKYVNIRLFPNLKHNMERALVWKPHIRRIKAHVLDFVRTRSPDPVPDKNGKVRKLTIKDVFIKKTWVYEIDVFLHRLDKLEKFKHIEWAYDNILLTNFKFWKLDYYHRRLAELFFPVTDKFSFKDFKYLVPLKKDNSNFSKILDWFSFKNLFVSYSPDLKNMNYESYNRLWSMSVHLMGEIRLLWAGTRKIICWGNWFLFKKKIAHQFVYFMTWETNLYENQRKVVKLDLFNKSDLVSLTEDETMRNILEYKCKPLDLSKYNHLFVNITDHKIRENYLEHLHQKYYFYKRLRSSRLLHCQLNQIISRRELEFFSKSGIDPYFYFVKNPLAGSIVSFDKNNYLYNYINNYLDNLPISKYKKSIFIKCKENIPSTISSNNFLSKIDDKVVLAKSYEKDSIYSIIDNKLVKKTNYGVLSEVILWYKKHAFETHLIRELVKNNKMNFSENVADSYIRYLFYIKEKHSKELKPYANMMLDQILAITDSQYDKWFETTYPLYYGNKNILRSNSELSELERYKVNLNRKRRVPWNNFLWLKDKRLNKSIYLSEVVSNNDIELDILQRLKSKYIHSKNIHDRWMLFLERKYLENSEHCYKLYDYKLNERFPFKGSAFEEFRTSVRTLTKDGRIVYLDSSQLAPNVRDVLFKRRCKFYPSMVSSCPPMWLDPKFRNPKGKLQLHPATGKRKFKIEEWYEYWYLSTLRGHRLVSLYADRTDYFIEFPPIIRYELMRTARHLGIFKKL